MSRLTQRYARTIVALVAMMSVAAVVYSVRQLEFLTKRSQLIAAEKPYLRLEEQYEETFHGLGDIVVVAESPQLEQTKTFVRRLASAIQTDTEHVREVFFQVDTASLNGKKLLLLTPTDLRSLHESVEEYREFLKDFTAKPSLQALLQGINHQISVTMVAQLTEGLLGLGQPEEPSRTKAPLRLTFVKALLGQMEQALGAAPFSYASPWTTLWNADALTDDGYLVSDDHRFVFLLVEPRQGGEDSSAFQETIDLVRSHARTLQKEFPQVQAGVTGDDVLGSDEMRSAQADSSLATILSLSGVGALYLLFFGSVRRTCILVATIVMGLSWTAGFTTLTVGHLSIISIFVASLLVGLADDRIVFFLSRYEEERDLGKSFADALRVTFTQAAPGMVVAACANALAFYAMMLADFRGIQELGFIAGSGMLLSLLVTLTFLPALLTLFEGRKPWQASMRRNTWLALGFVRWGYAIHHFQRGVFALAATVSLLCFFVLPRLTFDANLLHQQAQGTESVIWEQKVIAHAGRSSWFGLATASSLVEAAHKAAQFEALPTIDKVESMSFLAPDGQAERLRFIAQLQASLSDLPMTLTEPDGVQPDELKRILKRINGKLQSGADNWDPQQKPSEQEIAEVRSLLTRLLARLETLPEQEAHTALERWQSPLITDFTEKWTLLRGNVSPSGPLALADFPAQVRGRFVRADNQQFLLLIYPRQDIWESEPLTAFVDQLRQVDPDVTGSPVISYESILAIKRGYITGGFYAAVAAFLVAFGTLRRLKDALLALLPVVGGMLWTSGLMWLFRQQLNFANLVVVPITIGIGIESGLYLVRRVHQEAHEGWQVVGGSTGQAVALFSLSTMVGFGSLLIARHYGIFSMGLLLVLAVGSVLAVALTVLPLLLRLTPSRATRR